MNYHYSAVGDNGEKALETSMQHANAAQNDIMVMRLPITLISAVQLS